MQLAAITSKTSLAKKPSTDIEHIIQKGNQGLVQGLFVDFSGS